jgi:LPPG:FO 2-phospho-L-lactate transferase
VYTVLAGGVGASRFLQGLVQVVDPAAVTSISNTGDDVDMFGLHVSPDVDIVIYALAGVVNPETGWGIEGDTFVTADALKRFGYERWFNLGDRDMAMAIHRTRLLREGRLMHDIIAELTAAWDLQTTILPMSNERIETRIIGDEGEIAFQDYMVKLGTEPEVREIKFAGIESSRPAPGVLEALTEAETVIIAPSNPLVSIGPILAVPGVHEALSATQATKVAVSPIIAGDVVKGPAAKMMRSLGHEVSAVGVAEIYRDFLDVMVIDEQDRDLAPRVEALGMRCVVTDTMMTSDERKAELARDILEAAGR